MRYSMTQLSATVRVIKLGRERVGTVTQYGSRYTAVVQQHGQRIEKTASEPRLAFEAVISAANRIALCGKDDVVAAMDALDKRNAEVRQQADEWNNLILGASRDSGLPVNDPLMRIMLRRVRKRRIRL